MDEGVEEATPSGSEYVLVTADGHNAMLKEVIVEGCHLLTLRPNDPATVETADKWRNPNPNPNQCPPVVQLVAPDPLGLAGSAL